MWRFPAETMSSSSTCILPAWKIPNLPQISSTTGSCPTPPSSPSSDRLPLIYHSHQSLLNYPRANDPRTEDNSIRSHIKLYTSIDTIEYLSSPNGDTLEVLHTHQEDIILDLDLKYSTILPQSVLVAPLKGHNFNSLILTDSTVCVGRYSATAFEDPFHQIACVCISGVVVLNGALSREHIINIVGPLEGNLATVFKLFGSEDGEALRVFQLQVAVGLFKDGGFWTIELRGVLDDLAREEGVVLPLALHCEPRNED
jgi:hypothetical protein